MKEKYNSNNLNLSLVLLCWGTIIFCLILKLFGSRQFEIPPYTIELQLWQLIAINFLFYSLNGFCFALLLAKRKLKIKEIIIIEIINIFLFIFSNFNITYFLTLFEIICNFIFGFLLIKEKPFKVFLETLTIIIFVIVFQFITLKYKNLPIFERLNIYTYLILDIDYYLLMFLMIRYCFKKGGLLYVQIFLLIRRWVSFLVLFSKRKRNQESLPKNQKDLQEVEDEVGYKCFVVILSLFQIVGVGTICYFINKVLIEYFIIIFSFFILRSIFGKSYHANSIIKCTTLSMLVFLTATKITLPKNISILCNVIIGAH